MTLGSTSPLLPLIDAGGNILLDARIVAGLNVFLGAFLGALLGYGFSQYQRNQEHNAKQEVLLEHLRRELGLLRKDETPIDPEVLNLHVPIRVNVIPRLLDGELLEYRKHGTLIDHLILLEQLISRYNDWAQLTNEAQTLARRSPIEVRQMQERAEELAETIEGLRINTLPLLGVSRAELRLTRDVLEHTVNPPVRGASTN